MFDSGIIKIYKKQNTAEAGFKPQYSYTLFHETNYGERTVGIQRYNTALQNDARIEQLVRIPSWYPDSGTKYVAVLEPYSHEDGTVYELYQVQQLLNEDNLPCTDLSLIRFEGIDYAKLTQSN